MSDNVENLTRLRDTLNVSHRKASEVVYEYLRQAIIMRAFSIGDKLNEETIASVLSISRTPIREAFRKLEGEGLVKRYPGKGVQVTGLTEKDIEEYFQIRMLLEPYAAYLAAKNSTAESIKQMENVVNNMAEAFNTGDLDAALEHHSVWSLMVSKVAGNKRLHDIIRSYTDIMRISSAKGLAFQDNDLITTHKALTEAIKSGDSEASASKFRIHLEKAYNRMLSSKDKEFHEPDDC